MNYLAIDASTEACSVALSANGVVTSRFELCPQSHSLLLLPMVDEVLKEAGLKIADLDGLIFGRGPGSFTGVRIGIGVAQGLAFSGELPVIGISTLQAMAQQAYLKHGSKEVISAIDARMSEVYAGFFSLNDNNLMVEQIAETVIKPELLAEHYSQLNTPSYGVGTGWNAYAETLSPLADNANNIDILYPHAEAMLAIGIPLLKSGHGVSAELAQPEYVRDTVSWKKLPGRE